MKTKTLLPVLVAIVAVLVVVYLLATPPGGPLETVGGPPGPEPAVIDESDYLDDVVSDFEDLEASVSEVPETPEPAVIDESDYLDEVLSDLEDLE